MSVHGDLTLDESFFPVLWDESGYRTPWLAELPALSGAALQTRMRAHLDRMRRLMEQHESMMR